MGQRGRPRHPDVLTPREQDVLSLIREGLTNEQIAARLGITFETAKHHVSEILSKLGVETREEAAAWREERRWSPGRIALGAAGVGVIAATIAGLALLAWGVSQTRDDPDPVDFTSVGVTECKRLLDSTEPKGDDLHIVTLRDTVCWQNVPGASEFLVRMTVHYYGDCDVWHEGKNLDSGAVDDEASLAGSVTHVSLPPYPDADFPHPKDVSATVLANDASGAQIAVGGLVITRELDYPMMCDNTPPQLER